MPCYEVNTISVEFHAENRDLLKQTVDNMGWGWRENSNGTVTVTPRGSSAMTLDLDNNKAKLDARLQGKLNELKRSYSFESLRVVAKRQNWSLSKKPAGNKFTLMKGM